MDQREALEQGLYRPRPRVRSLYDVYLELTGRGDDLESSSSEEDELNQEAPPLNMTQQAPPLSMTQQAPPLSMTQQAPPLNMTQQAPPLSMTQQAPPLNMTQQAPPLSMTQQAPPLSMTQQAPPLSTTQQAPPLSMTQQAPPLSMTQQAPPLSMTQQAPPLSMTQQPPPLIQGGPFPRATPFNLAQWVSPSRVAQTHLPNLAQAALDRLAGSSKGGMDDSTVDFKSPKKRKVQEEDDGDCDNEGQVCSICFEPWTNSGGHRIASLRCGHLFGHNCIEKWLKKAQPMGKCPQCNMKARGKDIRVIYAKSVSVVDTTERDRALKELEAEKALRITAQKAEAQAVLQYQLAKAECERLRVHLELMRQDSGSKQTEPALQKSFSMRDGRYVVFKSLNISQSGGSRVLAHNPVAGMLVASKPSSNQLLPGYGVLKLSTLDLHCSEYVAIHKGALRDMSFSPRDSGMLLTVGVDKAAKLSSMHSNATVQSYTTLAPAWACAWNQDNEHLFYCGLQNGTVQVFDTRNTAGSVVDLHRPGGVVCPVTSLAFVPLCRASTLSCGGLLMGTLEGCVFWEKKGQAEDSFTPHALHGLPEGSCTSLSFDMVTRHCLASHRPSKSNPHSRHTLFQLTVASEQAVSCQTLHQFTGGTAHKLLSRSKLFQQPGSDGRLMVAFGDEATNTTHIWDATTQSRLQHLAADNQPTLDILPYTSSGMDYLAILTESKVFVHQWQWS